MRIVALQPGPNAIEQDTSRLIRRMGRLGRAGKIGTLVCAAVYALPLPVLITLGFAGIPIPWWIVAVIFLSVILFVVFLFIWAVNTVRVTPRFWELRKEAFRWRKFSLYALGVAVVCVIGLVGLAQIERFLYHVFWVKWFGYLLLAAGLILATLGALGLVCAVIFLILMFVWLLRILSIRSSPGRR